MADQPHSTATDVDSTIEILVPLRTQHAATLRVIVASLGSDHGLNVDEIDDLQLAVSEVFAVLVEGANDDDARARVTYSTTAESITVDVERIGAGAAVELDALAATILSSVVDEHRITDAGFSLVMFRRETNA